MKLSGNMRRSDRAMEREAAEAILRNTGWGVLSLNDPDEGGYGVPVNYVYTGGCIFVHGAAEGRKIELIRKDNRVGFTVVDRAEAIPEMFTTRYRSVVIAGRADFVEEGDEKNSALESFIQKFSPGYMEKGMEYIRQSGARTTVIRIRIETVAAKERT